jgi:hypothetical protein
MIIKLCLIILSNFIMVYTLKLKIISRGEFLTVSFVWVFISEFLTYILVKIFAFGAGARSLLWLNGGINLRCLINFIFFVWWLIIIFGLTLD